MPLLKQGRLAEDSWLQLDDEAAIAPGVQVIVSLERWQAERETLAQRNTPIGIRLRSDQSPTAIAEDVQRFAVIALEFPKFTDGRSYSSARLLRERLGFEGELRAVGKVLRDQFSFMLRCGFDAFEVADAKAADDWLTAIGEVSVRYQAAADSAPSVSALRRRHPLQAKADEARKAVQVKKEPKRSTSSSLSSPPTASAAVSCTAH